MGEKSTTEKYNSNRQSIYAKTLAMVKVINNTDSKLREAGVELDFDDERKPAAKFMKVLFENPKDIICAVLGLELRTESGYYRGMEGHLIPITIDVYYPIDNNAENFNFSISFESMWDLIDKAADNVECAKRVWNCFINKNKEDKEWLKKECKVTGWAEESESQLPRT